MTQKEVAAFVREALAHNRPLSSACLNKMMTQGVNGLSGGSFGNGNMEPAGKNRF